MGENKAQARIQTFADEQEKSQRGGGGGGGGGEREGSDKTESVRLDWRDLVSILVYLDGQDKG